MLLYKGDRQERLVKAVLNLADLVDDEEWLIEFLTGAAGRIEERKDMAGRKKVKVVELPPDRAQQLKRWRELSTQLGTIKNEESQLRTRLVLDNFNAEKLEGSETIDIGWGWRLKATKDLNVTATNESQQTEALLQAIAGFDPDAAQNLIRWKPEVNMKVYREMLAIAEGDPILRGLLAAAITVKPGMPQLEMIEPKEEAPAVPETVANGVPIPAYVPPVVIEEGFTMTDGTDIDY